MKKLLLILCLYSSFVSAQDVIRVDVDTLGRTTGGKKTIFRATQDSATIRLALKDTATVLRTLIGGGGGSVTDSIAAHNTRINSITASVATNTGNITALQNIAVSRRAYGVTIPAFKTIGKFDNIGGTLSSTDFAIHSSGIGLVTSSAGTHAFGYLRLPQEVTGWNFTRTDWLVSYDMSETGRWMTFSLGDTVTGYKINLYDSAGYFVVKWPTGSSVRAAMTGVLNLSVSFATGNGGITASVSLLGLPSLGTSNPFRVPVYEYQKLTKTKLFYAGFKTNATSSKITGFTHNKQGWDGDPTGQLLTQTVVLHGAGNVYNVAEGGGGEVEHDNIIIIPARSNLATPLKVVSFFHNRTGNYATFIDVSIGDNGETARQLLNAGYAISSTTGGSGYFTAEKDYWGNDIGTERAGEVFDAVNRYAKNVGKEYLVGWSMGGVSCANYLRRHPERVAVIWLWQPVLDMEETGTGSVQADVALKTSIDNAYASWYLSIASSNTADPQTDGGTNWRQVSGPGELPTIGVRNYQITTVGTAATNSSNIVLASSTRIYPGDVIYFKFSGQTRTVTHQAIGQVNNVRLDAPITVAVGDPVSIIRSDNRAGYDYYWLNRSNAEWSASTQGTNVFFRRKSANPVNDIRSYNPIRFADLYAGLGIKFRIMVGGDGTSAGNDGILNNAPMFAFRDAVNAINPGLVTILSGPATHLGTTTATATDVLPFFAAN